MGGGVLYKVSFGLWEEFHFQGCVFWVRSDLDSGKIFISGGGGVLEPDSRTGVFWRIWSKISGNLAWKLSLLVHHRLRTTYVETNNTWITKCFVSRYRKILSKFCVTPETLLSVSKLCDHVCVYPTGKHVRYKTSVKWARIASNLFPMPECSYTSHLIFLRFQPLFGPM